MILHYGAGLRTYSLVATFLAAFLGMVNTFLVFDTLKCCLLATVKIIQDDTRRRGFIERQRRARIDTKQLFDFDMQKGAGHGRNPYQLSLLKTNPTQRMPPTPPPAPVQRTR